MSVALYAEFAAATPRADRRHFDWFTRQGVPHDFLWRGAMRFGVSPIVPSNSGLYEPIEEGRCAVIMPAIPLLSPAEWSYGDDIFDVGGDLVAWFPEDPSRWWVRTGSVPIMNMHAITGAEIYDEPLKIHSSPLAWMRASGDGVVVLDATAHLGIYLGSVSQLVCDTVELGREIDRRLREPQQKIPTIMIPNIARAA